MIYIYWKAPKYFMCHQGFCYLLSWHVRLRPYLFFYYDKAMKLNCIMILKNCIKGRIDRNNLMKVYHFIRTRTFYKVRSPHWLLITFSICCYEGFFTPCKLSSWHIQNMLFIIDPERQLNKGSILMGHFFLFIFHFASICGEHFWCNISTKHWILNSYFPQTFWNCYDTQNGLI